MDPIRNENFLLPVTALAFCQLNRLFLLAGEGPFFEVFDHNAGESLLTERVFASEAIHGVASQTISDGETQALVLIWGGRSVCVVGLKGRPDDDGESPIQVESYVPEIRLDDWILDGCFENLDLDAWRPKTPEQDALLVTAHNEVHKLKFNIYKSDKSHTKHVLCCIASGPRSMLYSAHVVWPTDDRILIAAGTVFGEVLLWSFDVSALDSVTCAVLHHTFVGHEGSVFGVRISEPVKDATRLLASCSDDRTIRVWNVDAEGTVRSPSNSKGTDSLSDAQEAGFVHEERRNSSVDCLAMVMGHASRIWGLRFLTNTDDYQELLSHGEDGTAQIWRLGPKNGSSRAVSLGVGRGFELRHQTTFAYHSGKNLWAVNVHPLSSGAFVIATGAADGKITTFDQLLLDLNQRFDSWSCQYTIEEVCVAATSTANKKSNKPACQRPKSARKLFDGLKGRWKISRSIDSRFPTYPSGKFEGVASFEQRSPSDEAFSAEYLYSENGDFVIDNGLTMKATRQYVYRYDENTDAISVWFVKTDDGSTVDYFFHELDFRVSEGDHPIFDRNDMSQTLTAKAYHQCNADSYSPKYTFETGDSGIMQWSLEFLVQGPNKDYTTKATYTPDSVIAHEEVKASKVYTRRSSIKSNDLKGVLQSSSPKQTPDEFKSYSWVSETDCLASTQSGKILIGTMHTKQSFEHEPTIYWELVSQEPRLQSSCIATGLPSMGIAFLTGMDGFVFLYDHNIRSLRSVYDCPRKVGFLKAQKLPIDWNEDSFKTSGARNVGVFATCLGSSVATALFFVAGEESVSFSLSEKLHMTLPPAFIVTSSCFAKDGTIILGSRSGHIAIYSMSEKYFGSALYGKPESSDQVHGQEAVTVIQVIPTDPRPTHSFYILTAGRDGSFAIHQISEKTSGRLGQVSLQTLHKGVPPFGPNIEGACINSKDFYIWGFRSTDFVVWNESRKTEFMTVDCGGAHRNWAYHHNLDASGGGRFMYTKASVCHLHCQTKASHQVLQQGGHGREIKATALSSPMLGGDGRQLRVLATGAEDTTIRLFEVDSRNRGYECLSVLIKHTTGLQKLHWSSKGEYLFSAAGCEEFFVWRIRPAPLVTIGVVCEAKCPLVTEEGDLRIMDFAVLANDSTLADDKNPENESDYLLSMVYSDSSIRVFRYQTGVKLFTLMAQGTYTTHCLTQAAYLHYNETLHLCTGSTDGHLAFWPLPFLSKAPRNNNTQQHHLRPSSTSPPPTAPTSITCTHRLRIHQNSIKALIAIPLTSSGTLVITGGDDGAIACSRLSHSYLNAHAPLALEPRNVLHIPKAHASAVTALAYLGRSAPLPTIPTDHSNSDNSTAIQHHRIASTSNDQRLKTWVISVDLSSDGISGVEVRKEGNVYTAVADASSLEVDMGDYDDNGGSDNENNAGIEGRNNEDARGRRLWIAGVGIECWSV